MDEKLRIIRGDSQELPVTFEDENGDPIDITDKIVFLTVKKSDRIKCDDDDDDDSADIKKKNTVHTDPTNGKTTFELTKTDTDIECGDYLYDFQIVDGDNVVSVDSAILEIVPDITRRTE